MRISTEVVVNVQLYMLFGGCCCRLATRQLLAKLTVRDMWSVKASIERIATLLMPQNFLCRVSEVAINLSRHRVVCSNKRSFVSPVRGWLFSYSGIHTPGSE
jgi:hypothetical protein